MFKKFSVTSWLYSCKKKNDYGFFSVEKIHRVFLSKVCFTENLGGFTEKKHCCKLKQAQKAELNVLQA
eukprot:UN11024